MLKSRQELSSLREALVQALDKQKKKILVCAGTGCIAGGSLDIFAKFEQLVKEKGLDCVVSLEEESKHHHLHDHSIGGWSVFAIFSDFTLV